ncbi:MAG: aminopeptidase P family protein [Hyphomicrobiales bacterium]|nr:aminopeptidase P family protein [Hyphomicrobiales bacterium]
MARYDFDFPENRTEPFVPRLRPVAPHFSQIQARFQSFTERGEPQHGAARAKALRKVLKSLKLDGILVPRADIFQGEYIPASENRLGWLTGFTGSAGFAILMADRLPLFVDGRYTVQAKAEVNRKLITVVPLAETSPDAWLKREAAGTRIGYDPHLFTARGLARFERAAKEAEITLVATGEDPFATVWENRPAPPATPVIDHPETFAGESREAKIARLQESLREQKLGALLVSECPSVNWLFNIRAGDVPHLPILRAFALVPAEGKPSLFVDPARLEPGLAKALAGIVEIVKPGTEGALEVEARLITLAKAGLRLRLDEESAPLRFSEAICSAGGTPDLGPDPIALMKARKNATEIAGARAAHLRDGVAMVRFLAWLDREIARGTPLTEIDAAVALEGFRRETNALVDVSFPSISAAGPNAALPHYRVTEATNRSIAPGLYLIDSGGQYRDGTTDITRTVEVKRSTKAMREAFTNVLRGMIAVARATFPKGTSGAQLDPLARLPLWEAGMDFDHGTGHGVGSFLSVHEGPQRLSKLGHTALEPGMMLSDEPGYYREGAFGIRIENLLVVEPRAIAGGERPMFGFETLTFCPIDRRLIVKSMLSRTERDWINAYHAETRDKLASLLDAESRAWLENATRPL